MTAPAIQVATYRGGSRQASALEFERDAAIAASHGYKVIDQAWEGADLIVTYQLESGRPTQAAVAPPTRSALTNEVEALLLDGYRVESQDGSSAVMVVGHRVNHVLHLLLTLVTAGLWLFVWIPVAIVGGEKRILVAADEAGRLSVVDL